MTAAKKPGRGRPRGDGALMRSVGMRLDPELLPRLGAVRARLGGVFRAMVSVSGAVAWLLEVGEAELARLESMPRSPGASREEV